MNKLFLHILISLFSVASFAQGSNLTIFSEDGERFYLILNGIRQNEKPETNIRVAGLTQPYYSTKVIFEKTSIPDAEKKNLPVQDPMSPGSNQDVTYKIKKNKDATFSIRYYSAVPIAQAIPAPSNVAVVQYNAVPMPAIGVNVSHTSTTTTTTTSGSMGSANVNMGINVPGINVGINVNDMMGGMGGNTQVTHSTTTTTTSSGYDHEDHTGHNHTSHPAPPQQNVGGCGYAMPSAEFNDLMNRVKGQSFSEQKMKIAKQGTKVNCPTVDHIRQIAKQMMMDEEKLEFVKYAYDFCWNRKDYYKLSDVFSFSGTTDEFNSFLGN
jgi:hypothetical protein